MSCPPLIVFGGETPLPDHHDLPQFRVKESLAWMRQPGGSTQFIRFTTSDILQHLQHGWTEARPG